MRKKALWLGSLRVALDQPSSRGVPMRATDTGSLVYTSNPNTNTNQQNLDSVLVRAIANCLCVGNARLAERLCNSRVDEIKQIAREQNALKICRMSSLGN